MLSITNQLVGAVLDRLTGTTDGMGTIQRLLTQSDDTRPAPMTPAQIREKLTALQATP